MKVMQAIVATQTGFSLSQLDIGIMKSRTTRVGRLGGTTFLMPLLLHADNTFTACRIAELNELVAQHAATVANRPTDRRACTQPDIH